jgi:hypothetical protein
MQSHQFDYTVALAFALRAAAGLLLEWRVRLARPLQLGGTRPTYGLCRT